jgi:hypothetical protein
MNKYEISINDIYERGKGKKITVESLDVYSAHKLGLKHTNALREEISKIMLNDKMVYNFKNGFFAE